MRKRMAFFVFSLLFAFSVYGEVRDPAVADQFYPGNPEQLSTMIDQFLKNVPDQKISGTPMVILVPHAGYVFSAQTAAYAFKLLEGRKISTVVLIGNSHQYPLNRGAVAVYEKFRTPLGEVPVDVELGKAIIQKTGLLEQNNLPHKPEHSLEVELPFLQKTLGDFKIVPILLSEFSLDGCKKIGEAVAGALMDRQIADQALIVISSDMSHYPTLDDADQVDGDALEALKSFDPALLQKKILELKSAQVPNLACVFCGEESLYAGMYAAKALGAQEARVLHYTNSGKATGDGSRVVGYSAVAFLKSDSNPEIEKAVAPDSGQGKSLDGTEKKDQTSSKGEIMNSFSINEKNQKTLLTLARESIQNYVKTGKRPEFKTDDSELLVPSAVFVTLTRDHHLRGCIGTTVAQKPLYEAVSELAVSAAVEDPRFQPVQEAELKDIKIEISVLSPLQRIKSADEIKPNLHGVVVRRGFRSGLFLPQVWEQLPDKEDFLNELCWEKAGLNPEAWKEKETELYIFTVFAFEEK